jgi:hypothetical protein
VPVDALTRYPINDGKNGPPLGPEKTMLPSRLIETIWPVAIMVVNLIFRNGFQVAWYW